MLEEGKCFPPLADHYAKLSGNEEQVNSHLHDQDSQVVEECDLPLIDVRGLRSHNQEDKKFWNEAAVKASIEWGLFQVVNHGISHELLEEMKKEQKKLFSLPFEKKINSKLLGGSYRWGNPTATSLKQLSWSEAFHLPLSNISDKNYFHGEFSSLRDVMENLDGAMSGLACFLAAELAKHFGYNKQVLTNSFDKNTCFLRLNHYPPCPLSVETFGLVPHTDSDFLTILYQDQVGGLQLKKGLNWIAVKPKQNALIVNIGDLFQAWSNDVYKSVEHKVVANMKIHRYSIAYFLYPSNDTTIKSCLEPSLYRTFTFEEYKKQVQEDVQRTGQKVGLSRFLI